MRCIKSPDIKILNSALPVNEVKCCALTQCDGDNSVLVNPPSSSPGEESTPIALSKGGKPVKVRPGPPIRYLAMDFVVAGIQHRASVRDEPRDYADKIRRFYREASDRLTELSHGDSERYAGEQENCWARMACALDELREMENL